MPGEDVDGALTAETVQPSVVHPAIIMNPGEGLDQGPTVPENLPSIATAHILQAPVVLAREGIKATEHDPSLLKREKFHHLRFAPELNDKNQQITEGFKVRAAGFQTFVDSFKKGELRENELHVAIAEINQFMCDLWDICAIEDTVGKITFEQYKSILESLGQEYLTSYSYKSFKAESLGSHERMREAYEFSSKADDDPEKLNLWNHIHCTCEAAIAVISRTELTVKGGIVESIDGEKLQIKGAVKDMQERIEARQGQILKEIPCGTGEWTMSMAQYLLEFHPNLFTQEPDSSKILFLLRDLSGKAVKFSINRFKEFLQASGIEYKEVEQKDTHDKDKSVGIALIAGNIEFNFVRKDETADNGDPYTSTEVDERVTLGLWDYFSYEEIAASFERAIHVMKDGATMHFGQFMKDHPSRKYMEIAMDWPLILRDPDTLYRKLLPIAERNGVEMKIFYTPGAEKTQLLVQVDKALKPNEELSSV